MRGFAGGGLRDAYGDFHVAPGDFTGHGAELGGKLAANPVGLGGLGAGGGAGEEELVVELDFDGAACVAGEKCGVEESAELPGGVGVEGGKAQEGFLLGEDGEVLRGVWGEVWGGVCGRSRRVICSATTTTPTIAAR